MFLNVHFRIKLVAKLLLEYYFDLWKYFKNIYI